jgi:hypothetical protein
MELKTFLDMARANDATAQAIMLVTDFDTQTGAEQSVLMNTLERKGFMDLSTPQTPEALQADTLAVIQASFKRSVSQAARLAASIIGLEIVEVKFNDLMEALNAYEDCEQIIDRERFFKTGALLRELIAVKQEVPDGPTPEDCQQAAKIELEVHLPDGVVNMTICTACAKHFIATGEGAEMWAHPKKTRTILAALVGLMMQSETQEVRIPRYKLN